LEHEPFEHTWFEVHVMPQPPQLALSVFVFAQYGAPLSPPQNVCVPRHVLEHAPLTQTKLVPQTVPQPPQFASSVFVSAQ
jgi:hypothetical protein